MSWRHGGHASSCHIIFIHNYSRKNYRNPSRTSTLLHVWRAKPCMTTSSSHQKPDDENVCRHLTHHRKAKHRVKRSLWEGVRCVGKAKLQKSYPGKGQVKQDSTGAVLPVQAFHKPTLKSASKPRDQKL